MILNPFRRGIMEHRTCPRCSGSLYVERGTGYNDLVCLQCGCRRSLDAPPVDLVSLRKERRVRRGKAAA